ncbi:MAG: hypothetical protein IJ560_04410 [Alphaproteobacteria bacterium]|nr:hypothetical protein [Alphaproteobacteria bacterium]
MNKKIISILPLGVALVVGSAFFVCSYFLLEENVKNLLINLSATLVGITISYFSYNKIQKWSDKKLQQILFDYSKSQIDSEILSIINQIQKMIYPLDNRDISFNGINKLLSLSEKDLVNSLEKVELLGYQIFKNWDFSISNIKKIIENEFTLKYMSNNHVIILVDILNSIENINRLYNYKDDLFENTGKVNHNFIIVPPNRNQYLPDRSILLRKMDGKPENTGIVVDFGDLPLYKLKYALNVYKIKNPELYIKTIYIILKNIKKWLKLTNNELFITLKNTRVWDKEKERYL